MARDSDRYHFVGLSPFLERSADALGLSDPRLRSKARSIEHVGHVQTALGQLFEVDPQHQADVLTRAIGFRDSLAAALDGVQAAIREVCGVLDLEFDDVTRLVAAADPSPADPAAGLSPTPEAGDSGRFALGGLASNSPISTPLRAARPRRTR
jgi:hypothetical protein